MKEKQNIHTQKQISIPVNLITNNCVGMLALYPFGCQASIECQKLAEATVGIWMPVF